MLEKEQYRSNAGGLAIAYHTDKTVYFNSSLKPWVTVTDCTFVDNKALLPGVNTQQQIIQAVNNHTYFGRGGGLGIFLDEFFIDIAVDIQQCWFNNNYAESFGGGLYIYIDGNNTQHNFTVNNCTFMENSAGPGGFGGGLQVALLIHNADSEPSQLDFIHCRFIENAASFGGGLSIVQVYSQGSDNKVSLRGSYFEGNMAADVGSSVMFAALLYVQNRKSSFYYQVSDKYGISKHFTYRDICVAMSFNTHAVSSTTTHLQEGRSELVSFPRTSLATTSSSITLDLVSG